MAEGLIKDVSDATFEADVLRAAQPVLVDFWAPWCGPCRTVGPIVADVAASHAERLTVAKVNVDDSPMTASRYGIRSIPTLMLFKDGEVVASKVGAEPKARVVAWVDSTLAPA